LYGDDGELQDGRMPFPIDWMRDSALEIRAKIEARGMMQMMQMAKDGAR